MNIFGKWVMILTYCTLFFSFFTTIEAKDYSILDFGAKQHYGQNNTKAIQKTIDACSSNGGGKVIFPTGTWLTGTIYLKSNVCIYLSSGAIWKAINDSLEFPYQETVVMSRENKSPRRAMIYANCVAHVKILGEGMIDGGGDYKIFQIKENHKGDRYNFRPFGIYMVECQDITIDGIRMQNSAIWMQRYQNCENLKLTNLVIYNHSNLNNDGIDIDGCQDVIVSNCIVDATDDALCLKSEGVSKCKNIVVSNCILSSHATPLKLGTGSIGGFENIAINNIVIRPSKSKKMLHELKSWRGLSGIDILCVDGGVIDGVSINNVVMDSVETPIFIKLGNRHSRLPGREENSKGKIRNIRISNIIAKNTGGICSAITGYPGAYIENIWLSDIFVSVNEGLNESLPEIKIIENSDGYPYNRMFGKNLPATGFYIRHANNVVLNNFQIELSKPDNRPAIWFDDALNITLQGLKTNKEGDTNQLIVKHQSTVKILD